MIYNMAGPDFSAGLQFRSGVVEDLVEGGINKKRP